MVDMYYLYKCESCKRYNAKLFRIMLTPFDSPYQTLDEKVKDFKHKCNYCPNKKHFLRIRIGTKEEIFPILDKKNNLFYLLN